MFDQGSAPGPLPDAAGAGGGDVPAPNAAPPGAAVPGAESPDAPALAERLASLAPGADLAALVEGLMSGLLGPVAPAPLREEAQGEPVLLDEGLLAPWRPRTGPCCAGPGPARSAPPGRSRRTPWARWGRRC